MRNSRRPYYAIGGEDNLLSAAPRPSNLRIALQVVGVIGALVAAGAVVVAGLSLKESYDAAQAQKSGAARVDEIEASQVSLQNVLSASDVDLVNRVTLINTTLCNKIATLNETVAGELMIITQFLNATDGSGTFGDVLAGAVNSVVAPQVELIDNTLTLVFTELNERVQTINGIVVGNATMGNIDIVGGDGIDVSVGPGPTDITVSNAGVTSVVASGPGVAVSPGMGDVTVENTGVVTLNWVESDGMRNVDLVGAGLDITPNANSSTVTVDATMLVTAINNLQMTDAMQATDLTALQNTDVSLQSQINNIQMAGDMVAAMVDGTTMNFNETIMELLVEVMAVKDDIVLLQSQIASIMSGTATPTGAIMPWSGAAGLAPSGYLLCDGTAYNVSDYGALFAVIAETYCPGGMCAMGEFQVPDLRGRVPVGQASDGGQFDFPIGAVRGSETHTLTVGQIPGHTHSGTTAGVPNHAHGSDVQGTGFGNGGTEFASSGVTYSINKYDTFTGTLCNLDYFGFPSLVCGKGGTQPGPTSYPTNEPNMGQGHRHIISAGGAHSHTFTTDAGTGGGGAHPIVQPSLVMQYIIKT